MTHTMRAFVVTAAGVGSVEEVPVPSPGPGEVLISVERVGVCGTDVELFAGNMAYFDTGHTYFPLRLGHEWSGTAAAVGAGVDPTWIGRRVVGDTMIGDGTCRRCRRGRQHVCDHRDEVGVRSGRDGALAELVALPARSLYELPEAVDAAAGALVEPAGTALRAARATECRSGDRALILGPGTMGLLTAMFLRAQGAEVHLMGENDDSLAFARSLGFDYGWLRGSLPDAPFDAVVEASTGPDLPALALDLVEPGGRVVYVGIAANPSVIDTRTMALKDVTCVGVLSGSPAVADTIAAFADGSVDPRPLVAAVVTLDEVADVLAGERPPGAGPGPKIHIDLRPSG